MTSNPCRSVLQISAVGSNAIGCSPIPCPTRVESKCQYHYHISVLCQTGGHVQLLVDMGKEISWSERHGDTKREAMERRVGEQSKWKGWHMRWKAATKGVCNEKWVEGARTERG